MINKYLSKKTKEILIHEGWYENRKIDIEIEVNMLKEREYTILDSFRAFYSEFGRIEIYNPEGVNNRYISFILEKSFIEYDELLINIYPKIIGCRVLNRIGSVNGELALAIDENSKIYLLYDSSVTLVGTNSYIAIDNLCTKEWRWFDEFTIEPEEKWGGQIIDWKYVRAKEIENHKKFIEKYPTYKSFYE